MALSRVRLRLAIWFAAAVMVVVAALDVALFAYLRADANRALNREVRESGTALARAIADERRDTGEPLSAAARDAISEWPAAADGFAVFVHDTLVAAGGPPWMQLTLARERPRAGFWTVRNVQGGERHARVTTYAGPEFAILSGRSAGGVHEYDELLLGWLFISVPAVTLLAVLAGYLLAGRALRPVEVMADAIAAMEPEDLDKRLAVREPPDELDRLAAQFNGLLSRLSAQRARNRAFIQQAAHQLRTPLTVVRGESALGLERPRDAADYRETLARVRRAAEQMSHRVDELFVLAEAEAGQRPSLTDDVELDGLALECTDLLRGRAQAERRTLELHRVEPVLVRGNATLLREALVELLANAIKHGAAERPVAVSVYQEDGEAVLSVSSGGPRWVPVENGVEPGAPDTHGLGLAIVRWIADVHHGTLRHEYADGANVFAVRWPA
ncbi:MAG TPA: histidine kinase dimerization/phospho-acceptor domain-containing protein [Gemmatimonadales bacterium]|nr:histidine kinase dimerization/phospho-acceptor domain-containing protein [Gemmatimonadales bacterium]